MKALATISKVQLPPGTLLVKKDGSRIPVMVGGALLEKEPMMWVCFVLDITAQKNIEREREMLLKQLSLEHQRLQDANAWAELYVDIMAHDINSTNQTSMSYLELAMGSLGPDSPEYEYLGYSLEAINNSTKLIESVRKLQRVKNSPDPEPTDIGQLLQEVKASFISAPGREVFIDYMPAAGYLVKANHLLKDVFTNVIGYSFKHSDTDKPLAIGISLIKAYEGGQVYCKIIIEDNGSGMPDDVKGKVFTTFTRDNVRSKISGIGLYLVRTIIEEFKGRVWVEDRIQGDYTKGSRFVIMLPAIEV
jgi:signal transduction histidine kinase